MKIVTTDFLVVGSGSGGMVGAITAHELGMDTILIEKSKYYSGSSAMSGGGIWAPNNPILVRHGIKDSVQDIVTYMSAVTQGLVPNVVTTNNEIIEGLYATGNVSGSVMGRDYAGAGSTIDPSMIFAYVTAKHAIKL